MLRLLGQPTAGKLQVGSGKKDSADSKSGNEKVKGEEEREESLSPSPIFLRFTVTVGPAFSFQPQVPSNRTGSM